MTVGLWAKPHSMLKSLLGDIQVLERSQICDLMVSDGVLPDVWRPCECKIAVIPGDASPDLRYVRAGRVVTYGLSPRNTVTVSSMTDKYLMLAIQNEILNLDRRRVECQEFFAPRPRAVPPDTAIAAATALLVLGFE
ncbi:hypothetical protein FACS1894217_02970 [Clostridia bacterium]|nr:hypothetical protein FACS1894217_02970 [Clostridia bacterium]